MPLEEYVKKSSCEADDGEPRQLPFKRALFIDGTWKQARSLETVRSSLIK